MAFKQPNLVNSDDPATARNAEALLKRRCHGTTTSPRDLKVLWMNAECALVKQNAFSYGGSSYSGSVYLVDCATGGSFISSVSLNRVVHVCGKNPFCVGQRYTGGHGRLTADILHDLIVVAPLDFMVWKAEVARAANASAERAQAAALYRANLEPLTQAVILAEGDLLEAAPLGVINDIMAAAHAYRDASDALNAFPATLNAFIAAQDA